MENEGNNNSPRRGGGETRIPPKRGQVKVRIFKEVANKVKAAVTVVGFLNKKKGDGGNYSSTTTTPPPSFETEFKAMETKAVKKTKAIVTIPPKRGQIKAKIFEGFVETVVTITRPSGQTKNIPDDVLAGAKAMKLPGNGGS
ncbi:hypothetical protein LWI28_009718 [Acer negundo]|uniref:Uncharacterized protein n=1 Tax=Acer negundo TaxID=4023 RepID=A0AAD5I9T8_ACENE|nr:hypothetical protein LWI28_009718 [Acer negundo]KAK4835941.1 hypothetical protein QYF36_016660 [Acer negundo]